MSYRIRGAKRLRGRIAVPGDKSISHRAAIFNAIADGKAVVRGFLTGEDCMSTVHCLQYLGVDVMLDAEQTLVVQGVGLHGLREPAFVLDAGNSGTTMRLLAGLLAGQPFFTVLTGDDSLRNRPMGRVLEPLRWMGATCLARQGDLAPIGIRGGGLKGIAYRMPVASAQVKSSLLLGGLFADGDTVIDQPAASRDHTERMLRAMGADIAEEPDLRLRLEAPESLEPVDVHVPGDISAAAFWMVLAAAHPDAEITLPGVGVNPTRSGIIDALRAMGADIEVGEERTWGGEPIADVTVRSGPLRGVEVGGKLIPRMIDEVPVFAVAAALAEGRTVVRDAEELRVKESDRIAAVVSTLRALGADVEETPDGMVIEGGRGLRGGCLDSGGDHRLAMTQAVAGVLASGETEVMRGDSAIISYPGFWQELSGLVGQPVS